MGKEEQVHAIEMLIDKAATAEKSDDALKFSQAACNASNAMCAMRNWLREDFKSLCGDSKLHEAGK